MIALFDLFQIDWNKYWPFIAIGALALLILIYLIYVIIHSHVSRKFISNFAHRKNNIRLFTVYYLDKYVYVVDKMNFKGKRKESLEWFYDSFIDEDKIRVKVWISELVKQDHQVQESLDAHIVIRKIKSPIFSVLTCTGIDYEKGIIHLESHLFPEIRNRYLNYRSRNEKIGQYNELSGFYNSLKREKANVYLVRIFPKDETYSKENIWTNKVLTTLLMSRIKKFITGSMKMCLSKNNELIILENHIGNKSKTIAFAHNLSSEVSKILFLNSLQNNYQYRIGIATTQFSNQSFNDLVRMARKMTFDNSKNASDNVIYNSNELSDNSSQLIRAALEDILNNPQIDIEYTAMLDCDTGHVEGFYTDLIFKHSIFSSVGEIEEYSFNCSLLDPMMQLLYSKINSVYINKYFITSESRKLFIDIRIQYYSSVIRALDAVAVPENVRTVFVLNDKEVSKEASSNSKFLFETIHALKAHPQIVLGLELTSTSLELSNELLKSFDYFLFNFEENFSNVLSSTQDQILLQNLVNRLFEYPNGKLCAIHLPSWQAIEYFTMLGFHCVSASYFGKETNKIPPIDTKRLTKLMTLND